jgi:hypothetical protein
LTRVRVILAALVAALVLTPGAHAAATTYTVNDPGDASDANTADLLCDVDTGTSGDQCTLRAAIQQANVNAGTDTIIFTGAGTAPAPLMGFSGTSALPSPPAPCCAISEAVIIDGNAATTVAFDNAAAGPLLDSTAPDTIIRRLTFTGGATGPVLSLKGARARVDRVTVHDTPGTAIQVSGANAQLPNVVVRKPGGIGIAISGADAALTAPALSGSGDTAIVLTGVRATVTAPDVDTSKGNGITLAGNGSLVSAGKVRGSSGDGIAIQAQNVVLQRVVIWGNGGKPIALAPGANGGIQPPQDLRIGPRQPDGSLPLTGSASGGSIDLWSGTPFGPVAPSFLDALGAEPGTFAYRFQTEPPPGSTFALTLTAGGTSEFSAVTVPDDVVSPDILRSRALSTTEVRVHANEALDPASAQPEDFTLTMAGQDRKVTGITPGPDGSYVTLTSSGWKAGEAGYVQLVGPGAITDAAGNNNLGATRLRVAAAPGDFIPPLAGGLALTPRVICLTRGKGCNSTGMTIKFVTTEAGKATIVVQRGDKRIGKRLYGKVDVGPNALKFNGLLGGRKLRAGRYRLLLYVQDAVGNVTDQPPITLFSVRRVTK